MKLVTAYLFLGIALVNLAQSTLLPLSCLITKNDQYHLTSRAEAPHEKKRVFHITYYNVKIPKTGDHREECIHRLQHRAASFLPGRIGIAFAHRSCSKPNLLVDCVCIGLLLLISFTLFMAACLLPER
ncbi:hypothetical protein B0T10DRAFT_497314 [Thelonectria olida]|uniref:Uncharacterized protein n=1 Tax=Thelonectria olida TaxID=1576542 RepID=A0A9P8VWZ0_9HYPO|nr:hypothetical protein B0T10DRAFT_497314 [Thelonectria olida]